MIHEIDHYSKTYLSGFLIDTGGLSTWRV